ncbi:hypothetical protein GJAV_G00208420 [Gymnothorax javanicus]|nr:hypothetical protein GJAV_G00208420 [Gymnothorax javanicus]
MAEVGVWVPQEPLKASGIMDERIDFLREQATTCLRLKTDKWNRFIASEENQKVLLDFLDKGSCSLLVLFSGPGGTLHVADGQVSVILATSGAVNLNLTPVPWKTKLLCIQKRRDGKVSKQKFRAELLLGEVSGLPLEQLPVMASEVLGSILVNGRNHSSWPRAVTEDIRKQLEKLRSRLVTLRGAIPKAEPCYPCLCVQSEQKYCTVATAAQWTTRWCTLWRPWSFSGHNRSGPF